MLDIYTWSVLITGIFYTSFGIFAYVKNRDLPTRLFAFVSISFAVWSYSWFFLLRSDNLESAIVFSKLLTFGATFIPIFYLHWVLSIVDLHKRRKVLLVLGYIITSLFAFLSFTDFYISGVRPILFFSFWPIAGPAFTLFILVGYVGMVFYALFELARGYKKSVGDKRHQIIYLFLGSLLGFGGGATNFPLMYGISFMQPFGIFLTMTSPLIFSYAAVRYKFMDIKVVATQFFAGAINIIFIINLILSRSTSEIFFNTFLLVFVFVFTVLLIRGVRNEILQREKIEKLAGELKKVNDGQTSLIHFMNHQIKGRFGITKNIFAELLTDDYGTMPPATLPLLQKGLDEANIGVAYVMGILKGASAESGTLQYEKNPIDFKSIVQEVFDAQKEFAEKKGLKIDLKIDDGDYSMLGDKLQMGEAVKNLIDNSINYTPEGRVFVNLSQKDGTMLLKVTDTGVGITAEDKPNLFKAGGRGVNSLKVNVNATGYGLVFVRGVAKAHGGHVWAESEGKGLGSTFFLELPKT